MNAGLVTKEKFFSVVPASLGLIALGSRFAVRRLPRSLQ
jgi:hypothetical protein